MLRLKEVASQSQTFPKRALEKQNVNRTLLLPRPATGRTLQLFSIDRPPLLAVIWRSSRERLCSFNVVCETCGFWNGQSILTHSLEVKLNSFTHPMPQFLDGFAGRDTARQVGQVRRIVSFARLDNHCVSHNVKLYFFKAACVKILFKVLG